ncbi:hypothetical protein [Thaumasiovibrio subtropicus]|uniref:hypothetical protein n=1 Tax=Thaumasiovibrio subtropicus TaxID=1891207 RepID=UPI000B35EE5C|nr:hypothetical protein [Thaumasiovibrio subtropicus]
MKIKLLSVMAVLAGLVGCATTAKSPYTPTVSPQQVEMVRVELAEIISDNLYITDDGFVVWTEYAPAGYEWEREYMRDAAFHAACDDFLPLLESGFVFNAHFKGRKGSNLYYNLDRCLEDKSTGLYR